MVRQLYGHLEAASRPVGSDRCRPPAGGCTPTRGDLRPVVPGRARGLRRQVRRPVDGPGLLRRERDVCGRRGGAGVRSRAGVQRRDLRAVVPGGAGGLWRHVHRPVDGPDLLRRRCGLRGRHGLRRWLRLHRRGLRPELPGGRADLRRQVRRPLSGDRWAVRQSGRTRGGARVPDRVVVVGRVPRDPPGRRACGAADGTVAPLPDRGGEIELSVPVTLGRDRAPELVRPLRRRRDVFRPCTGMRRNSGTQSRSPGPT